MNKKQHLFMKNYFESNAWLEKKYVCGIDEAGRGCLSGPLVAAAAILQQNTSQKFLKDSKVMSKKERETAYEWISKNCFYSYVIISPHIIEARNIYKATQFAMKKAFLQLLELIPFSHNHIKYLVSDAVKLAIPKTYSHKTLELYNPTHCESISPSVAAASIVAKVTRDRLMHNIAPLFPQFLLEQHKGYGTTEHINTLIQYGPSIIHRPLFIQNFVTKRDDNEQQQTIC